MIIRRKETLFVAFLLSCVAATGQALESPRPEGGGAAASASRLPIAEADRKQGAKAEPNRSIDRRSAATITPLNSVVTASPAESFALNGSLAYVCDDNEVSVIDVSTPASPRLVTTALSGLIQNSADIHCGVQRNTLIVFGDQTSTLINGPGPAVTTFSLANPLQPALITATPLNKRFFDEPVYLGNYAFVPTNALHFFLKFQWDGQLGDLISVDLGNLSSPALVGTLEQPQVDSVLGGQGVVLGATQADALLIYLGGSTSTGGQNNGSGRLQVADVSNPAAMQIASQLLVPGTIHFNAPQIQGNVAVGIGNNGGYGPNGTAPQGNIVVATFNISNRRAPTVITTLTTTYKPGPGSGATRIGNNLFAFAGVLDAANNKVLLTVDITNPAAPALQSIPISQPVTRMEAAGTTLYATLGSAGFATYAIPGVGSSPTVVCPASIDAVLVVDRGTQLSGSAFSSAKVALKTFVDSLHLQPDQIGVVSFTGSARLDKPLNTSGVQSKAVVDDVTTVGGGAYIGAGIAAAQQELTSARHIASATPVIVVLSDGMDSNAPNSGATAAAATAAKAAGIRIIALQYGAVPSAKMQAIASSASDFYLVAQ